MIHTSTNLLQKALALAIFTIALPVITIAQWSAPIDLYPSAVSATTNESMGTCIGTSGDTVHVVWSDQTKKNKIGTIYYSHSVDTGSTWSAPVALSTVNKFALNPAIAINGRNVHVVWREIDTITGHRASWYKHSLDGGKTWGPAVFIDSTADWPAVSVSGKTVYIANDRIVTTSPYNTEIFFLRSTDNGATWGAATRLSFAVGRSEDEAIYAEGAHVHMSWNDNRTGKFKIFYKESADFGVTWDPDVALDSAYDYSTMVYSTGAHADVVAAGIPKGGHYQILLSQSADTGATWSSGTNVSNDTAHAYFYPDMVRDGSDIHITYSGNGGGWYLHSADGGTTWDPAYFIGAGGSDFVAYTGCALHVIYINANHLYYIRNLKGNTGSSCSKPLGIEQPNGNMASTIVYPNPAKNNITIRSNAELGLITIYNLLGETVYTEQTDAAEKQVDISKLPAGVYILHTRNTFMKVIKE